jgi:macrolide transport system ATP-binding/permease protein
VPDLELHGVCRLFPGDPPSRALDDVTLTIRQGELVAIVGPSGGGKSTLLNVLGLLDTPTTGSYVIDGVDTTLLSSDDLARHRSDTFAFVFQAFHLLDRRPLVDSVQLGLLYRGVRGRRRRALAVAALARVGLAGAERRLASTLSGGERQRVAVARALATSAPVLLADEPTGNLDSATSERVVADLVRVHAAGATVVLVTHDPAVARVANRVVRIRDGRLDDEDAAEPLDPVLRDRGGAPVEPPTGRASTLRLADLVGDALASLGSRVGRSAGLATAVAVGVALAVATLGLSQSAREQVTQSFDAHENRQVTAAWVPPPPGGAGADGWGRSAAELAAELGAVAGVVDVGLVDDLGRIPLQATPRRTAELVPVHAMSATFPAAGALDVDWAGPDAGGTLPVGGVLLGETAARLLEIGPLVGQPEVVLAGRQVAVVGIIRSSPRVPELLAAVVVPLERAGEVAPTTYRRALVTTVPGAARQVAGQVGTVIDPAGELAVDVAAPVDPRTLRDEIESEVAATLAVLSVVVGAASVVGLANAMVMSVLERRQEIGVRRAVGARARHITALVLGESVVLGAVGGVGGLALGLAAVLGVTLVRRWAPVVDPGVAPLAVLAGVVIGAAGGLVAAWRASRVDPSAALRM